MSTLYRISSDDSFSCYVYLRLTPPAINSSPDDRVVTVDSSCRPGRSPILTQEDVARQYAWTVVEMFEANVILL